MRILALAILTLAIAIAAKIPLDVADIHRRADTILYPEFVAASNAWAIDHPKGDEHYAKFDKGDAERLKKVRKAFHDWDDAMKQAGY